MPITASLKPITKAEEACAKKLSPSKAKQYHHSRGYLRLALSDIFGIKPLNIPLKALPGQPPHLGKGWGHISLSHCLDALLIGWSPQKIGVDIERQDRVIQSEKIFKRYFSAEENSKISSLNKKDLRTFILQKWTAKEAAIKWQHGKLSTDFRNWHIGNEQFAIHQLLGLKVFLYSSKYKNWYISIASKQTINEEKLLICLL